MEWISTDDRFPEVAVEVLFFAIGDIYLGMLDEYGGFYCEGQDIIYVTHWMPITPPEAP